MKHRTEQFGDATLILGDCLEVMAEMEAGSVDAVVTDPPYGIGMKSQWISVKDGWPGDPPLSRPSKWASYEWCWVSGSNLPCYFHYATAAFYECDDMDMKLPIIGVAKWSPIPPPPEEE